MTSCPKMTDQCLICGCGQEDRPMCFENEDWCSENCRKLTIGEKPIPDALQ